MESCLNFLIVIYYITEIEKLTIWIFSRLAVKSSWPPLIRQKPETTQDSASWELGGVRWHWALICFLLSFLWLHWKKPWKWSSYLAPQTRFVSWTDYPVLTWYQGTWGSWGWWCCQGCSWWCCGRAAASPGCGSRCILWVPPPVCCGTNLKQRAEIKNWPQSDPG